MPLNLPPQFKQQIEEKIPQLRAQAEKHLGALQTFLGPLWAEFGPSIMNGWQQLRKATATRTAGLPLENTKTLGGQFKHLMVVGLNRSELLMQHEETPVWGENWQGMMDEGLKKNLGLIFFAPRDLDGRPSDPIPFLMGETEEGAPVGPMPTALQGVAMLDFCRMPPAIANTVNILVAADCLFHWDSKGAYVSPTSQTGWIRDVEGVIRSYPRTTKARLFTQWDATLLPQGERLNVYPLRDLPLESLAWLNEPTVQEKYASHMLGIGLIAALLTGSLLWWQGLGVDDVTEQLNMVQQQIPQGGQFSDLERAVSEQEKMFALRPLFALSVKDVNRAISKSNLQIQDMELKVPDTNSVPDSYVLTLTMPANTYNGWLQQEPVARAFLVNTAMVHAIRKPPSTADFKLEGLIMLKPWLRDYTRLLPKLPSTVAPLLNAPAKPVGEEGAR